MPSSLANANNCLDVDAKQLVPIIHTRMNIIAVMPWAPAVLRLFCRIHTRGKAWVVAVGTSVMAKRKTRSIEKASGMLSMYDQNMVFGVTSLALTTSSERCATASEARTFHMAGTWPTITARPTGERGSESISIWFVKDEGRW